MPYQRISEETKRRIVAAFEADEDYLQTTRLLNVSWQMTWQLVQSYLEDGQVVRPCSGARAQATRTDEEMMAAAVEIAADYPVHMLRQINAQLQQWLPNKPRVSLATVAHKLDGQLIRIKKLEDAPVDRNVQCTLDSRHKYVTWITEQGGNKILVFIDEAGKKYR